MSREYKYKGRGMNLFLVASMHGKKEFLEKYEEIENLSDEKYVERHRKMMDQMKKADAVFAELSYTSSSAGYTVAQAVNWGKPVVVFYSGDAEPHLLRTLEAMNDKLIVVRYSHIDQLDKEVPLMIDFVTESQDTRFNFFVSPNIAYYLDWISKHRRVPRSVYLRRLIDEDMEANEEYTLSGIRGE